MKSYFLKCFLNLLLFPLALSAQDMFWEINGTKGGKVYILGTLDVGDRDLYPLRKEIQEAFTRSNYLILELRRGDSANAYAFDEMYVKARYDANDSLNKHISSQTYKKVQTWLKQQKLPLNAMDRFKPWVIGLTLSSLDMALWGGEKRLSLTNYFYEKARRESKGVYALEHYSEAFLRLSEMDYDLEDSLLQTFIAKRSHTQELYDERFKNYQEGNLSYFEQSLLDPFEDFPIVKEVVLDEQNALYTKKVKLYRNNRHGRHYFLIMNLEHLLGDTGVLAQLKEAGIEVKSYEALEDVNP